LWLRKPSYAVLFSDLDITSAGEVAQELEQMGEDYKVARGGTTILVPAEKVAELRINLASEGVIHTGGVGYEIFDNNEIGVTDLVQRLNMKRALEGELSRTISSLTAVEKARVHIVFPKESIFKNGSQEASASVVVGLRRGYTISQSQILGITNLVSYSVEGLSPDKVTVIDQGGNTLTRSAGEQAPGLGNAQIDIKRRFESYLAGKAEEMLAVALGPGKAIVRVNADLDFRAIETTKETYDPQTVVRSEQVTEESNTQEGSRNESTITNYDINRTVETIIGGGGGIKSLSVAAFVDGHYGEGGIGGTGEYTPLTEEELSGLEDIVKGAVGFDPSRNDVIKIVNVQFYSSGLGDISMKTPVMDWLPGVIAKIGTVAVLLMLFLLLRKNLGRLFSGEGRGIPSFTVPRSMSSGVVKEVSAIEPSLEDRTKEMSGSEPEQVAKLVKTWMAEG
jgi:flagellar M-ring protein FliF